MRLGKHLGLFFPWSDGIGTVGIKVGRFYADIFWSDWSSLQNDEGYTSLSCMMAYPSCLLPSGIYLRMPWFQVRSRIVGGGQYYLFFRRFWRGFKRR